MHERKVIAEFTQQAESFNSAAFARAAELLDGLVRLAAPQPHQRWLDVACGPGLSLAGSLHRSARYTASTCRKVSASRGLMCMPAGPRRRPCSSGRGRIWKAQITGSPTAAIEWLQTLPGPVRAVYEAGPTGFGLARAARAVGVEVMVCSPGAIPCQPGDRIKTDLRDALKLARLHAAGQLRAVSVPTLELEELRDLVRAREDLRGDLMAARHRISKMLLRRGQVYDGPGHPWEWEDCRTRYAWLITKG